MCNFLSAIVLRNGDVLCLPEHTDSHADLIAHYSLPDDSECRHFAKVEFTPGNNIAEVDGYTLSVDEDSEPAWFEEHRDRVTIVLRDRVANMIIGNRRDVVLGGCWILIDGADIGKLRGARIVSMSGHAEVADVRLSTVSDVGDNATVTNVGDNATVTGVWDNATVTNVGDNATVTGVGDNATVTGVWDNATVTNVGDNATVSDVGDNATVTNVGDNATVTGVWDNATVTDVWGNATVSDVGDNAKVINDKRVSE